jgi:hypothetical protein
MIKTTKDGRTILSGQDYRDFKMQRLVVDKYHCSIDPVMTDDGPVTLGCGRFIGYCNADLHHIDGRGMGGSKRDDTIAKTRALCRSCHIRATPKPIWSKLQDQRMRPLRS